jgi:hypothetical protein
MLSHMRRPKALFSSTTARPVSLACWVAQRITSALSVRNTAAISVSRSEMTIIRAMNTAKVLALMSNR